MKVLCLMPIDEKWSYIATALYAALPQNVKDNTFAVPMFSEWQMATKKLVIGADLPLHWNVATFGSLIKAKEMFKLQESLNKDFLLIGNIDKQCNFDIVFNFQDPEKDAPYEDKYIEKLTEVFKNNDTLSQSLVLHKAEESTMSLHNINAAAEFLASYLNTDPHLDEIKARYEEKLNFKKDIKDA